MEFKDALDLRIRDEVEGLYLTVEDQTLNAEDVLAADAKTGPGSAKAQREAMANIRWKDGFFREYKSALKQLLWVWEQVTGEKHDRADDVEAQIAKYYAVMRKVFAEEEQPV